MTALHLLYAISGSLLVAFYIPQMLAVARARTPCHEISLASWATWTLCMIVSAAYGAYVLEDTKATTFSLLSGLACGFVFVVAATKRRIHGKAHLKRLNRLKHSDYLRRLN